MKHIFCPTIFYIPHTEKYGFKIVPFWVQQLVPGAVPLKGHICTFFNPIDTYYYLSSTLKVLICPYRIWSRTVSRPLLVSGTCLAIYCD